MSAGHRFKWGTTPYCPSNSSSDSSSSSEPSSDIIDPSSSSSSSGSGPTRVFNNSSTRESLVLLARITAHVLPASNNLEISLCRASLLAFNVYTLDSSILTVLARWFSGADTPNFLQTQVVSEGPLYQLIGSSPSVDTPNKPAALLSRCPRSTVAAATPAQSADSAIATVMTTPSPVSAGRHRGPSGVGSYCN
jgi:hypothetical protein